MGMVFISQNLKQKRNSPKLPYKDTSFNKLFATTNYDQLAVCTEL